MTTTYLLNSSCHRTSRRSVPPSNSDRHRCRTGRRSKRPNARTDDSEQSIRSTVWRSTPPSCTIRWKSCSLFPPSSPFDWWSCSWFTSVWSIICFDRWPLSIWSNPVFDRPITICRHPAERSIRSLCYSICSSTVTASIRYSKRTLYISSSMPFAWPRSVFSCWSYSDFCPALVSHWAYQSQVFAIYLPMWNINNFNRKPVVCANNVFIIFIMFNSHSPIVVLSFYQLKSTIRNITL